ncbi:MAG: metallophosphoesterase [Rhizobiales bacterium 62-17]|nr:metallophosphoesterase [Hyphomicrobiales bacterium]OJY02583.1 MAG: metallophosphoesterase [Rhizobiales bacterium 62-17]
MVTRRAFLRLLSGLVAAGAATSAYGIVIEPLYRLQVTRYALKPRNWPADLHLRLAIVADIHACSPWMTAERVAGIVARTNAVNADMILLLGDYIAGHKYQTPIPPQEWAQALQTLSAPLGVHAVLGNHDWWQDRAAMRRGKGPTIAGKALEDVGIKVFENEVARFEKDGKPFWLAGLGDQIAFVPQRGWRDPHHGIDNLPATLAQVTDDAPIILMAHEPDIFPNVPDRVSLTLSGHTHGGQVRIFGYAPVVPSHYGRRFVYGHVNEGGRDLIISGGLGCSIFPVRIGAPPEIVVVDLGQPKQPLTTSKA